MFRDSLDDLSMLIMEWGHSAWVQKLRVGLGDSMKLAQKIDGLTWLSEQRVRLHRRGCEFTGSSHCDNEEMMFDMHRGAFVCVDYIHGAHGFFDIADLVKIFANNKWDRCLEDESVWIIHTVNVTTGLIVNRMAKHVQKKWKMKKIERHHRLTNWMMRLGIILANKSKATCATSNPRESHDVGDPFHLNLMD